MKTFIYILIVLLSGFLIYNVTQLDFDKLLEGKSAIAAISSLASGCGLLLLVILLVSRKIATKSKQ